MTGQNNSFFHGAQVLMQNMAFYVSAAKSTTEHDSTMQYKLKGE